MLRNISPRPLNGTVRQSRRLRRTMSLPEVLLWRELRVRPAGLKFRRQHPTGPYTLDFFCSDARLAIEVDGEAHEQSDRPARDTARDAWLDEAEIRPMRIPAVEALHDLEAVLRGIIDQAQTRLPLHHPAKPDGPPPRDELGEDLK